jgi:putative ABC transport system substrate-binding protein
MTMRRREFITFGGAASLAPFAAHAQRPVTPVVGYINSRAPSEDPQVFAAFRQGLREMGFTEGQNVVIEYWWPEGKADPYQALAADLARRRVAVIAAIGDFPALGVVAVPTTVPIVFVSGVDPIDYGVVPRLNRPGGHITGVTTLNAQLVPKRLELLRELLPQVTDFGFLVTPGPTAETLSRDVQAAARTLGLQTHIVHASTPGDLDEVFPALVQRRIGGLVIGTGGLFNARSGQIAALALRYGLPTIYQYREFAAAGGLMSYGGSLVDSTRLAGVYTGRILKGEKPADLPVQQATRVELIINMKTAKALGLTFPITLLGRADEVIE